MKRFAKLQHAAAQNSGNAEYKSECDRCLLTIWGMIKEFFLTIGDIFTGKFSWRGMNGTRRMMFMIIIATFVLVPFMLIEDFFTGKQGDGDIVFEVDNRLYNHRYVIHIYPRM